MLPRRESRTYCSNGPLPPIDMARQPAGNLPGPLGTRGSPFRTAGATLCVIQILRFARSGPWRHGIELRLRARKTLSPP